MLAISTLAVSQMDSKVSLTNCNLEIIGSVVLTFVFIIIIFITTLKFVYFQDVSPDTPTIQSGRPTTQASLNMMAGTFR